MWCKNEGETFQFINYILVVGVKKSDNKKLFHDNNDGEKNVYLIKNI